MKSIHFSIDDVNSIFRNLTAQHYKSAFEEPILQFLFDMHKQYGCIVSRYCFMKWDGFSLRQATDQYKREFEENQSWLRFGFHGISAETRFDEMPAEQVVAEYSLGLKELERIVGASTIDYLPRLHYWRITKDNLISLTSCKDGGGYKGYYIQPNNL